VYRAIDAYRVFSRPALVSVGVVVALVTSSLLATSKAHAQSEDQIMAAFLFNFARYVEWPEDAFDRDDMPVKICIYDAKEFGDVVAKTVSGKMVGDRAVAVGQTSDLSSARDCHIFFIGRDSGVRDQDAIAGLGTLSIFTVADREGFANAGGIANFFRADNRIRFEINPSAAEKAGLRVSSKLLRLAKVVK
jgi:hypothetical protein